MEKCFEVKEIAEMLGIAPRTVRKRIEEGKLEACKSKRNPKEPWKIPESWFYRFIVDNPDLPEVQRFKIEKMKEIINKLREQSETQGK